MLCPFHKQMNWFPKAWNHAFFTQNLMLFNHVAKWHICVGILTPDLWGRKSGTALSRHSHFQPPKWTPGRTHPSPTVELMLPLKQSKKFAVTQWNHVSEITERPEEQEVLCAEAGTPPRWLKPMEKPAPEQVHPLQLLVLNVYHFVSQYMKR